MFPFSSYAISVLSFHLLQTCLLVQDCQHFSVLIVFNHVFSMSFLWDTCLLLAGSFLAESERFFFAIFFRLGRRPATFRTVSRARRCGPAWRSSTRRRRRRTTEGCATSAASRRRGRAAVPVTAPAAVRAPSRRDRARPAPASPPPRRRLRRRRQRRRRPQGPPTPRPPSAWIRLER